MTKILEKKKDYSLRRRHIHILKPVTVEGVTYNVLSATPTSSDVIPKKVKELLKYLINGK